MQRDQGVEILEKRCNDMIEDLDKQNRQLEERKKQWAVLEETPGSFHTNVLRIVQND